MPIVPIPQTTESQTTVSTTDDNVAKWLPGGASHWIHFFSEAVSGEFALSALGWLWLEAVRRKIHHRRTENICTIDQLPMGWKRFPTMETCVWLSSCEELSVHLFIKKPGTFMTLPPFQQYPFIHPVRMSKFFGFEEPEGNIWLAKYGNSFVQLSDAETSGWGSLLMSALEDKEAVRLIRKLSEVVTGKNLPYSIPINILNQYSKLATKPNTSVRWQASLCEMRKLLFRLKIETQFFICACCRDR